MGGDEGRVMEYKQFSPDVVVRSEDGKAIKPTDPKFLAWLDDGNTACPPDPPVGLDLDDLIVTKQAEIDAKG
jgi:hypothetical protein